MTNLLALQITDDQLLITDFGAWKTRHGLTDTNGMTTAEINAQVKANLIAELAEVEAESQRFDDMADWFASVGDGVARF